MVKNWEDMQVWTHPTPVFLHYDSSKAKTVCIAKIFEQTHSRSKDIYKIVNKFYAVFMST